MEEIKCPCGLRGHMDSEDCDQTNCDDCCPLANNEQTKPMTHADRIRAMTDEELAKWMSGGATMSDGSCYYCKNNKLPYCDGTDCIDKSDADIILEWLQQPAEGDA